jgi:hypothetical protein
VSPANRPMTARERDLLLAIVSVLDIPNPASYEHRQGFYDELSKRAAMLCGALESAAQSEARSLSSVIETCRDFAAELLGYEAKPAGEPATARLADSPGFRQLQAYLDEADAREAGQ